MQNNGSTPRPSRQGALVILISFAVFITAIVITLVASNRSKPSAEAPFAEPAGFGHVHGLGVDPADGTLYVASHFGVFRVIDGEFERIADRYQDTMGFAVIGPQHFLASGHPDLREDLPASLGLIESTNGAETWEPLSLLGEADLHAIEPTDTTLYAIETGQGRLIATDDQIKWRTVDTRPLIDLAARPNTDELIATTPEGTLLQYDAEAQPTTIQAAPKLTAIDWAEAGLIGATSRGDIYQSATGDDWQQVGKVIGEVSALEVSAEVWYAATDDGVFASTDVGRTWEPVVET